MNDFGEGGGEDLAEEAAADLLAHFPQHVERERYLGVRFVSVTPLLQLIC